jgi:PAS domain-containing protein
MFTQGFAFKIEAEQLQRSELFYQSLIADSLDRILLTDETGIISFVSPSVKKLWVMNREN